MVATIIGVLFGLGLWPYTRARSEPREPHEPTEFEAALQCLMEAYFEKGDQPTRADIEMLFESIRETLGISKKQKSK